VSFSFFHVVRWKRVGLFVARAQTFTRTWWSVSRRRSSVERSAFPESRNKFSSMLVHLLLARRSFVRSVLGIVECYFLARPPVAFLAAECCCLQCYRFTGISRNLESSGNSVKVREKPGKRPKVGDRSGNLCSRGNFIVAA